MKNVLSSIDLICILKELESINNAVIKKIYQVGDELLFHLFINGEKKILRIIIGKLIHLTNYTKTNPLMPTNFCMYLRKYFKGGRVMSIKQLGLERIISMKVNKHEEEIELIIELFKKGNAIVVKDNLIKQVLKYQRFSAREIRPGKEYKLPPSDYDLVANNFSSLKELMENSDKDVIRTLATKVGLGGTYAEEVCLIAGVNKTAEANSLTDNEYLSIINAINQLIRKARDRLEPMVIMNGEEVIDVTPFPLKYYDKKPFKTFPTFNEALDFFYARTQRLESESMRSNIVNAKKQKLEKRLAESEAYVEELRTKAQLVSNHAMMIKNNLYLIERVIESLMAAHKKGYDWNSIKEMIKSEKERGSPEAVIIKEFYPNENRIIFDIGGGLELSLTTNVRELMNSLFTKAKKYESKIRGATEAVNRAKRMLESFNEDEIVVTAPKMTKSAAKNWYEKFKWFMTSNNELVIAGRNAQQNELIINKYLEPDDLVFHADIHGSPFTILRDGRKAGKESIEQAAQFTAVHSSAWSKGVSVDVYYINPYQVTKEAPSGEYLRTGGFMIKGKKNFIKSIKMEIGVGVEIIGELSYKLISGPLKPLKLRAKHYVVIEPGSKSLNDLTHELITFFKNKGYNFGFEEVKNVLPGDGRIINSK